jgi:hypothetical protein
MVKCGVLFEVRTELLNIQRDSNMQLLQIHVTRFTQTGKSNMTAA